MISSAFLGRFCWVVAGLCLAAAPLASISPAAAQDNHEPGSRRGLVPDASTKIEAQTLVTSLALSCRIGRADKRGHDQEGRGQYEVTCRDGPGYMLLEGPPNRAYDCLALEAAARIRGPTAVRCQIASNRNARSVVEGVARPAGGRCRIDAGLVRGLSVSGTPLYEVGCAGEDGFWLEHSDGAWHATGCLRVVRQGGLCELTTAAEQAATLQTWLQSGDASRCNVVEAVFRGNSDGTSLYEASCSAGDGWMVRLETSSMRVMEVYPCTDAEWIGGGCRLGGGRG